MDSSSIIRVQISLRTMIVIGFLRIHTALTPLPIAFTLLEAINKHTGEQRNWTKWRRHSKFSTGVLYKYVRVKGRNLQYSRSLHSSCKVPSECSKRTNIFLICIHFLSALYLSLPPGFALTTRVRKHHLRVSYLLQILEIIKRNRKSCCTICYVSFELSRLFAKWIVNFQEYENSVRSCFVFC